VQGQGASHPLHAGAHSLCIYTVSEKKELQFSLNNFNIYKRIFTIFGTHYPEDTFYLQHVKFAFEIYLSLCSADVIMTSSKMPFSREGHI